MKEKSVCSLFQSLVEWQCDIRDPMTSQFKKDCLIEAFLQFEKWIDSRNARIKEIDEELRSRAVTFARICKQNSIS